MRNTCVAKCPLEVWARNSGVSKFSENPMQVQARGLDFSKFSWVLAGISEHIVVTACCFIMNRFDRDSVREQLITSVISTLFNGKKKTPQLRSRWRLCSALRMQAFEGKYKTKENITFTLRIGWKLGATENLQLTISFSWHIFRSSVTSILSTQGQGESTWSYLLLVI